MIYYYTNIVSLDEEIVILWLNWMIDVHIPELFSQNIFTDFTIQKVLKSDSTYQDRTTYIVTFECESPEKYERYVKEFEPLTRKQFFGSYLGMYSVQRYFGESEEG
ncbi:MAG: DUF4286 family protein [Ignavibacteriaceae bacterium]